MHGDGEDEVHAGDGADGHRVGGEAAHEPP